MKSNKKATIRSPFLFLSLSQSGNTTAPVAWHHSLLPRACRLGWWVWHPAWQSQSGSAPSLCERACQRVYPDLHPVRQTCRCPSLSGAGSPPVCHCRPCRRFGWPPGHWLHQPRCGRPCCQPRCCAGE